MIEHELLKTAEVAHLCRVTPKTISVWYQQGKLPGIQLPGKELRFRRSDVEAILAPGPAEGAA